MSRLAIVCTGRRLFWMVVAIVSASTAVSLLVCWLKPTVLPSLRISAGPHSTRRHAIAAYLGEKCKKNKLTIDLIPTQGTEECLELLKAGRLDVALVNNGVILPDQGDIRLLAALPCEFVHVLVRRELAGTERLGQRIRGKRINLGQRGSTDRLLVHELLKFAHFRIPSNEQPGDFTPLEMGKDELTERAKAIMAADGRRKDDLVAEMPDCLLIVASRPSKVVQLLIEAADYHLEQLPGVRAFLADNLPVDKAKHSIIDREYLETVVVPAGSYFKKGDEPPADLETIGFRLLVVARNDVPAPALRAVMASIYEREFAHLFQPKSPRDVATPYAAHSEAIAYLDRDKPFAIKEVMEGISQSLSLLGAFSAGVFSLYGLLRWKRVRKPSDYFAEIRRVEELARNGGDVPTTTSGPTTPLADQLIQLRHELITDICEGRIKGDQVVTNILVLLKDVQRNLPRTGHDAAAVLPMGSADDYRRLSWVRDKAAG